MTQTQKQMDKARTAAIGQAIGGSLAVIGAGLVAGGLVAWCLPFVIVGVILGSMGGYILVESMQE